SVRYSGILRAPGTRFDVRAADARVLAAIGKVRLATDAETAEPVTERTMRTQSDSNVGTLELDAIMRRDVTAEALARKEADEQRARAEEAARQAAEKEAAAKKAATKEEETTKGRSKYLKDDVKKEIEKEKTKKSKGE